MSNLGIPHPRLVCAAMLGIALALCAVSGITLGAGWRTLIATMLCTTAVVHAVSLPDDRQSDVLHHWRMIHVGVVIVCMNGMIPSRAFDRMELLPIMAMLPIVAMATIRQAVGRPAAIVPLAA